MHRLTFCIHRATAAELPKMRNIDGTERPASEQDLLNLGMVPLGDDLYSCAVQEHSEDGRSWAAEVELPGVELSRGRPQERFSRLSPADRGKVMLAEVERTTGTGKERKTETITVREAGIAPRDVVKRRDIIPHMWAGERDR